jgi:hypothetical protein
MAGRREVIRVTGQNAYRVATLDDCVAPVSSGCAGNQRHGGMGQPWPTLPKVPLALQISIAACVQCNTTSGGHDDLTVKTKAEANDGAISLEYLSQGRHSRS